MEERLRESNKNPPPFSLGGPGKEVQQLQDMALGIPMAVCLLFKAMAAALTEEAEVHVTPPSTAQQSTWPANNTEADFMEGPVALKFPHPCLEDHHSYCINGVCAFHHELKKAICRCFTGYTGERCEHLTLTSYAVDSYEKYIAIGIGVGLLISAFLAVLYCYIRKRCLNLKSPYIICSGGRPL
ncbi:epigen isoform X1 [Peromyscus californicus insignis]|uniref:epigen isoform X1 n=1 Tax=Peromyscus californicus insignis TaxID=564181 RepID=UPI0022A72D23|nr:epigen isoform X1 [Peromyscus californicus insignis]